MRDRISIGRGNARGWVAGALILIGPVLVASSTSAQEPEAQYLALCVACHARGENPAAPTFPTLSGQHPEYLIKQLKDYKAGRRLSPIMVPPLSTVTKRDIAVLADYFSRQPISPGRPGIDAALVERGRTIYQGGNPATGVANCAGCHEATGSGSAKYPRIAGQASAYIEQQLGDFRTGTRTNDRARVMRVISSRMTDDDMKAVAEYIATLSGS
jgi:cytochrome c553